MRELISKTIDGKLYEFQQFPATVALKTLSQLTQLLGEPLTLVFGVFVKKIDPAKPVGGILQRDVADADPDVLAKAVRALITQLAGTGTDEALQIIKSLVSGPGVLCDHNKVVFDEHFGGHEGLAHLPRVLTAALEAQYGNFLNAVSAKLPAAPAARPPVTVR
jgi:hypothetical protein